MPKNSYPKNRKSISKEDKAKRRAASKKFYQNHPNAMKERMNTPEAKANNSTSKLKYYQDHPDARARKSSTTKEYFREHPNAAKQRNNTPKAKANHRAAKIGTLNPCYIPDRTHISTAGGYPLSFTDINTGIRERDNNRCIDCGIAQEEYSIKQMLDVHHIDLDRNNSDPDNLKTVCSKCHSQYHPKS